MAIGEDVAVVPAEPKAKKPRKNPPVPKDFPERVTVTMTEKMYGWVQEAAERAGYTSLSAFVREIVADYMESE
jgi:AraC-like DNA-binding protein